MDKDTSLTFTNRNVKVGNFTLNVRSNNKTDHRVVILVHGIGVSEKYFRPLADQLSSSYSVMSIDLPGYGESKKPTRALNLDELAEILAQFIRQENIINPVVIGQSMGCQIVARLGLIADLTLYKLILLSPTINKAERTASLQFFRLMQDSLKEPFIVNRIIISDYMKFGFMRFLKTQRYMIKDKIEVFLGQCLQPILIIRGENDKVVPRKWSKYLVGVLKNGFLIQIKDGPHNFQFTHSKDVAKICINFIEN